MARINIEECWWSDPRRMKLALALGSGAMADGVVTNAWRIAQEFWSKGRLLVPQDVWATVEANSKLIEANLAEARESGVYVRGSSQYLDWARERREAAIIGGKKSAEVRRKKNGSAQPKPEANPKQTPTKRNQTQPSDSGSVSVSGSSSEDSVPSELAILEKPPTPVGVYVVAYQARYGFRPEVGPKEGKILQSFAKNHPDRWAELIRGYLQMPDSWATARSHPVEVLVGKVNEVGRFLATGKVVTRKVVEHAEELIDKAQGTNRKPRRSLEEIERERGEMMASAAGPRAIEGGT